MSIHDRAINKNSITGIKGLSFHPTWKRWDCRVSYNKREHRNYFDEPDKELAVKWLQDKRKELEEANKNN